MAKLGLVLSGGGARGAYQVGVIRALAKLGIEPDVVAGASIGALNGALIAQSETLQEASEDLKQVWLDLEQETVLVPANSLGKLVKAAIEAAHKSENQEVVEQKKAQLRIALLNTMTKGLANLARLNLAIPTHLFSSKPIHDILTKAIDPDKLIHSKRHFYVSVFPASGTPSASTFVDFVRDCEAYFTTQAPSEFILVQANSPQMIIPLLMASSALPLAFDTIPINTTHYRDGGMGDRFSSQGNTPAEPILASGCSHAIVSILGDGDLWTRSLWNELSIIEIRPSVSLSAGSPVLDLLDFSQERKLRLMKQGELDTLNVFNKLRNFARLFSFAHQSQRDMESRIGELNNSMADLQKRIARAKKFRPDSPQRLDTPASDGSDADMETTS